jgi:methionyl-tRNA synthetase
MDLPWFLGNSREVMDLIDRIIVPLVLWQSLWKGFALWYAARRNERGWFIALLIVNMLGLLEIMYLVFVVKIFSREKIDEPLNTPARKPRSLAQKQKKSKTSL